MYTHLLQDQHNINVSEIKVLPIHAHYKQPTDNLDELIVYQTQTIDKKSLENIKDYRKAETIDISSTQSSDMPLDSEMIVYEDTIKTDNAQEESLYNSIEEIESENKSLNEDNIKSVNGIEILKDTSKTKTVQKTKEEKIKDKQIFDYTTKLDISYKMR
ncbi:MAG: hypothetical protein HOE82_05740 [Gammaproteobacteria bacterium]|jgi:hypothetical protein|nr:hypothetical protein [Gammaproteobacteria bacterium]